MSWYHLFGSAVILQWKVWFVFLGRLGGKDQNAMQGALAEESDAKLVWGSVSNWKSWDIMADYYGAISKFLQACLHSFFWAWSAVWCIYLEIVQGEWGEHVNVNYKH